MLTLRKATGLSVVFVLLFASACAPATTMPHPATQAPGKYYEEPSATEEPAMEAPTSDTAAPGQSPAFVATQASKNEPYDMFFQNYGVNPSIDTEDDNLSTFALDVDTGSYTVMRNYLSDGNLPPSDSVRVEEYVNFFEQGYPSPPAH